MTTPSQPNDELDKAVEAFELSITNQPHNRRIIIAAAQRSKELEKENDTLKQALVIHKEATTAITVKKQALDQQLSTLHTAYKQALEVLMRSRNSLEDCAKYFDCLDTTREALLNDCGVITKVLSNPLAIETRKGEG